MGTGHGVPLKKFVFYESDSTVLREPKDENQRILPRDTKSVNSRKSGLRVRPSLFSVLICATTLLFWDIRPFWDILESITCTFH